MNTVLEFYKETGRPLTDEEKKLLLNRDSVNYDPEPLDDLIENNILQLVMIETEEGDIVTEVFVNSGWIPL